MSDAYIDQRDDVYMVAGTRVSLDSIVYAFLSEQSAEAIAQTFPMLRLEQVYGAITYYLAHRDDVDGYLERLPERGHHHNERVQRMDGALKKRNAAAHPSTAVIDQLQTDAYISDLIFATLRMLGLGAERVQRVDTDGQGRMRPDHLAQILRGRREPCLVCAQIGNVNTGAVDPIGDIASLTRERGAWLHVDGAFGVWAATSESWRSLVAGIEQADSIATDGHTWLVPYDSGIVLTAHPEAHQHSSLMPAHYIQITPGEWEPRSFTPDESRRARGLPMYATLRVLGREDISEIVDRCCTLATRMAARLASHAYVRIMNDVVLNQVLVQFRPPGGDDAAAAALTQQVITHVQDEGTCWVGGTKWHGQVAMRIV